MTFSGCNGLSSITWGFSDPPLLQFCLLTYPPSVKTASSLKKNFVRKIAVVGDSLTNFVVGFDNFYALCDNSSFSSMSGFQLKKKKNWFHNLVWQMLNASLILFKPKSCSTCAWMRSGLFLGSCFQCEITHMHCILYWNTINIHNSPAQLKNSTTLTVEKKQVISLIIICCCCYFVLFTFFFYFFFFFFFLFSGITKLLCLAWMNEWTTTTTWT